MLWWLVVGAVLLLLPFLARSAGRQRALRAGPTVPVLASSVVGLAERLAGVDGAIEGVRTLIEMSTAQATQACAVTALFRMNVQPEGSGDGSDVAGPGTARFTELLASLQAIAPDDLRDLADAGLEPSKLVAAVSATGTAERWQHELLAALDYWQRGAANVRARRYG